MPGRSWRGRSCPFWRGLCQNAAWLLPAGREDTVGGGLLQPLWPPCCLPGRPAWGGAEGWSLWRARVGRGAGRSAWLQAMGQHYPTRHHRRRGQGTPPPCGRGLCQNGFWVPPAQRGRGKPTLPPEPHMQGSSLPRICRPHRNGQAYSLRGPQPRPNPRGQARTRAPAG